MDPRVQDLDQDSQLSFSQFSLKNDNFGLKMKVLKSLGIQSTSFSPLISTRQIQPFFFRKHWKLLCQLLLIKHPIHFIFLQCFCLKLRKIFPKDKINQLPSSLPVTHLVLQNKNYIFITVRSYKYYFRFEMVNSI